MTSLLTCIVLRKLRSRFCERKFVVSETRAFNRLLLAEECGVELLREIFSFRRQEKRKILFFFQSFDVFSSMLCTFVANIGSLLLCVFSTPTIWMTILLLLIYIKINLLLSDTPTTDKKRYVSVQFHAAFLFVSFVTQDCLLDFEFVRENTETRHWTMRYSLLIIPQFEYLL